MLELVDWSESELQNPGTPPWWVLAIKLSGETPTTHRDVFAAIAEDEPGEPCRVVILVEYGEVESPVLTPWGIELRVRREGVARYRLIGQSKDEIISVATPGD